MSQPHLSPPRPESGPPSESSKVSIMQIAPPANGNTSSSVAHTPGVDYLARVGPEISLKIWQLAFPTRRFVVILVKGLGMLDDASDSTRKMCASFFTTTQAAILQLGTQEVDKSLERYCFGPAFINLARDSTGLPGCIKFSYMNDVAFFSTERGPKRTDVLDFLGKQDMDLIQQVAIESTGRHWKKFLWLLPKFPDLTRIFVLRNKDSESAQAVDLKEFKLVARVHLRLITYAAYDDLRELGKALSRCGLEKMIDGEMKRTPFNFNAEVLVLSNNY